MSDHRDVAAWMEYRPDDPRRGCSTVWFPTSRAKCDQNQVELGAALAVSAAEAHRAS